MDTSKILSACTDSTGSKTIVTNNDRSKYIVDCSLDIFKNMVNDPGEYGDIGDLDWKVLKPVASDTDHELDKLLTELGKRPLILMPSKKFCIGIASTLPNGSYQELIDNTEKIRKYLEEGV